MSPMDRSQDDASYSVLGMSVNKNKVRAQQLSPPPPQPVASTSSTAPEKGSSMVKRMDYESYMSTEGLSRYPSPLKDLAQRYLSIPGIINFGGGLPHPSTFPVSSFSLTFPHHKKTVAISHSYYPQDNPSSPIYPHSYASDNTETAMDLSRALQYGGSTGALPMREFLKEHVGRTGGVGYEDWDLILTNGNTDGLDNVFRLLLRPNSSILVEEYAYPGTLAALAPIQCTSVGVKMDSEGLLPEAMDEVLTNWDEETRRTRRPRVVLIVPTGQNPSGATMSEERRKKVLEVARKWDLIVVCDDPYRSLRLHYPTIETPNPSPPPPTMASLDTDGRVIELCSFSKMVAPGSRLGWILAPSLLISKLSQRNEVTMQSVSGFSVAAMCAFLGAFGGQVGWERYLEGVADGYSKRAQTMHRLFQKHLPSEFVRYDLPQGGMFFFVQFANHLFLSPTKVSQTLFETFISNPVILTPSSVFRPDGGKNGLKEGEVWFRASFSFAGEEEMEEGARRLGKAIRDVYASSVSV